MKLENVLCIWRNMLIYNQIKPTPIYV
jgi:hypothetical protein